MKLYCTAVGDNTNLGEEGCFCFLRLRRCWCYHQQQNLGGRRQIKSFLLLHETLLHCGW
jgi:hypothetical protein